MFSYKIHEWILNLIKNFISFIQYNIHNLLCDLKSAFIFFVAIYACESVNDLVLHSQEVVHANFFDHRFRHIRTNPMLAKI